MGERTDLDLWRSINIKMKRLQGDNFVRRTVEVTQRGVKEGNPCFVSKQTSRFAFAGTQSRTEAFGL